MVGLPLVPALFACLCLWLVFRQFMSRCVRTVKICIALAVFSVGYILYFLLLQSIQVLNVNDLLNIVSWGFTVLLSVGLGWFIILFFGLRNNAIARWFQSPVKSYKRSGKVWLAVISVIILLIGGATVTEITIQQQYKQQIEKNLVQTKADATELLEWNYNDIHSVTFDYTGWDGDAISSLVIDKSLTTTPMGFISINGWVNGDTSLTFECDLDTNTLLIDGDGGNIGHKAMDRMAKNPYLLYWDEHISEIGLGNNDYLSSKQMGMSLSISDIRELQKEGYDKNITWEQIEAYLKGDSK